MRLRAAEDSDVSPLHRLSCACFGVNAWAPHQLTPTPERHVLLAECTEGLLGFCVLVVVSDEAEIQAMAVTEAWRRRGVGAALLEAAVREAEDFGAATMYLEVRASNLGAQAFYRRFEFEPLGQRRGYYHAPDEDAILMQRAVRSAANASRL